MRTVTIDRYHVWGTRGRHAIRLLYRGQCIAHLDDSLALAVNRARVEGFTHWRKPQGERVVITPWERETLNAWESGDRLQVARACFDCKTEARAYSVLL